MVLAWTLKKEEEHYFDPSFLKGKPMIIIIKLVGGWAMCQLQSRQHLSLKSHYTIITHQARHRESQISVGYRSLDQIPKCFLIYLLWSTWTITEDKVTQINLGDEANPKPIFISESLSPSEKEDLISLVGQYIDFFTWNYEDISGLAPQVAMYCLNINV